MLDPDPRRKMISLRLSKEEYELLKTNYPAYGARNISELARLALQRVMTAPAGPQHDFAAELAELGERVHELESRVSLLMERDKVIS
jgi:hypothetical protein